MTERVITLYRPVGEKELELIRVSGFTSFPPRLPYQPIFYPVLTEQYAIQIARDWNTKDAGSGFVGYVTKFQVPERFLSRYSVQKVGGAEALEYWIPAEELEPFNAAITGLIEVIHEFRPTVATDGGSGTDRTQHAQFPFGQILKKVCQTDRTPKRAFVLGVYASAVHARWTKGGKQIVRALAVASEPYIFWKGDGAKEIIRGITIPAEVGVLEPADSSLNGPSAAALDDLILAPLGLDRADAWLCDLVPFSCLNDGQERAIADRYLPLQKVHHLPTPTIPRKPKQLTDDTRRNEILAELRESKAETLILLGDEPVEWFLSKFDRRWKRLSDFKPYGQRHPIELDGMKLAVLPLVHPRQAAGLGAHSPAWRAIHAKWIRESASGVLAFQG